MATYAQWQAAAAKGNVKRVTWVCGPEGVLVREVEKTFCTISRRSYGEGFTVSFTAGGTTSELDIWEECFSIPAPGERKLVIVRESQLLEHMDNVSLLADRQLKDVWVLFVSSENGYDRKLSRNSSTGSPGGRELFPGPAAVKALSCGQLVKCVISEKDKVEWLRRNVIGLNDLGAAWRIAARSGYDLDVLSDVADKVTAARLPPAEDVLLQFAAERSPSEFEDSLIYFRKPAALSQLPDPEDLGRALALLSSRLDVLSRLWAYRDASLRELEVEARIPKMFVAVYRKAALDYPPSKVRSCRQLLATLDVAWRHGGRTGLAEALVAQW